MADTVEVAKLEGIEKLVRNPPLFKMAQDRAQGKAIIQIAEIVWPYDKSSLFRDNNIHKCLQVCIFFEDFP